MKKITLLFMMGATFATFAQQKTTGDITLSQNIGVTANFTLNNNTSKVTLVLKGPSNRWFGIGVGVEEGFGMSDGDALVFTTNTNPNFTDRNFGGTFQPPQDSSQDWTLVSNTVDGTIRTIVATRNLVTSDANDFQMPYATTNSIDIACVRPSSATMNVGSHGGTSNVGYAANVSFSTLDVVDFSLKTAQVYPNPATNFFTIESKTEMKKVSVYTQTGALVTSYEVPVESANSFNVNGLQTGVYLIQIENDTDKAWKKVIVQ